MNARNVEYVLGPAGQPFVRCPKCGGARIFRCWSHIEQGRCFKCGGSGFIPVSKRSRRSVALFAGRPVPAGRALVLVGGAS